MSKDITTLLEGWDYEPEEIIVRIVPGDDGRDKIQMRVDMGLLQMELDGRPDGTRPEGYESWLEYYEEQQRAHEAAQRDAPFALEDEDCFRLWREGVQYYQRYLSLWHLKMFDRCTRDTARNMRLFAFVRATCPHRPQQVPVRSVAALRDHDARAGRGHAAGGQGRLHRGLADHRSGDRGDPPVFWRNTARATGRMSAWS